MYLSKLTAFLLCSALLAQPALAAEPMDVDQSSTLDIEGFHTTKKDAVKLYDSETGGILNPARKEAQSPAATTSSSPAPLKAKTVEEGKAYEIRELYSVSGSERTGYTPSTVMQALHLQMQGFCPQGWHKLDERSVPDGDDFYMYYRFECL